MLESVEGSHSYQSGGNLKDLVVSVYYRRLYQVHLLTTSLPQLGIWLGLLGMSGRQPVKMDDCENPAIFVVVLRPRLTELLEGTKLTGVPEMVASAPPGIRTVPAVETVDGSEIVNS